MFINKTVLDWRTDGNRRVHSNATYNSYILNTNRMFEMTVAWDSNISMYYFDNPNDSRDGGARMRLDTTIAEIITASDLDYGSKYVTLNYFPNADTSEATKEISLQKSNIAYAWSHWDEDNYCYLVYVDAGWNEIRIVVDYPLADLLAALLT